MPFVEMLREEGLDSSLQLPAGDDKGDGAGLHSGGR